VTSETTKMESRAMPTATADFIAAIKGARFSRDHDFLLTHLAFQAMIERVLALEDRAVSAADLTREWGQMRELELSGRREHGN
jgi:hypothetical protein